jgi:PAS domain S-box-containing protein
MNQHTPDPSPSIRWRSGLAGQLTWISILLVVLSLIAVGTGLIVIARMELQKNALELQEKNAHRVALLISGYINHAREDLLLFEKIEPLSKQTLEDQRAALEKLFIFGQTMYSQLALLDRHGWERIRLSRFYTYLPGELNNQSQSPAFQTALKGGIYLSPVFISPDSGLLSVQMALPVKQARNEISGVFSAEVNISLLWQDVSRIKIGQSGYAYLVDVNGRFIAFQEPTEVLNRYGEDMRRMPPVFAFMNRRGDDAPKAYKYPGLKKESVIGAYAPIEGTTWAVIVEWPTEEAYAAVTRMQWVLGGFILLGVLMAGGLAYSVSRRVVKPIRALTDAAQRIGTGDWDTEVITVHRQDEVGILARTFQGMQNELKVLYQDLERQVTELQEMQNALRESEEHYRSIFENAVEGIFLSTPEGKYLRINPALSRMYGYGSPQEMMEQVSDIKHQLYIHPEDRDRFLALLNQKGTVEAFEVEERKKDGSKIWVSINARAVRDEQGAILFYEGTIEDFTLRKKAEEDLRAAHQRLFDIIEFLPEATYVIDRDKKVVTWNRACEEMTGVSKEEMIGRGDQAYSLPFFGEKRPMLIEYCTMSPEDWEKENPKVRRKDNQVTSEFFAPSLNQGQGAFLAGVASPLFDSRGALIGAIESLRDITDFKHLESQVHQAKKMESIGTLAGGIAHDFNNLLMSIQGNISLILVDLKPEAPHRELLKEMERQVANGADLTRQLLGFARGGQYEVKPTDLNELIVRTSTTFGRTRKEFTIHQRLESHLWAVEADRGQMEQVLLNLYINAWEAMPKGGDLYIETRNLTFERNCPVLTEAGTKKVVMLAITDTGTGMDEKTRERIFDPFFTTKEMGRGIGLGLASTYGIIKTHQGVVQVDSAPGRGTTFTIYLPASDKKPEKESPKAGTIDGGKETLLVIDDEKAVLKVTTAMLKTLGYQVFVAATGQEGIDCYRQHGEEIALVILDMVMPGMSGEAVFEALRNLDPEVKVVLSTGYSLQDMAQEVFSAGCRGFIQKPFTLQSLSRKIREVLDSTE